MSNLTLKTKFILNKKQENTVQTLSKYWQMVSPRIVV